MESWYNPTVSTKLGTIQTANATPAKPGELSLPFSANYRSKSQVSSTKVLPKDINKEPAPLGDLEPVEFKEPAMLANLQARKAGLPTCTFGFAPGQ